MVRAAAHVSVPVLLALYGYNKGYLDVVLENSPAVVPSMQDTLSCDGFLACNSSAVPLELATRYDGALDSLDSVPVPAGWRWRNGAGCFRRLPAQGDSCGNHRRERRILVGVVPGPRRPEFGVPHGEQGGGAVEHDRLR